MSLRWASGGQSLRTAWVDNRIRGYIPSGPLPSNIPRSRIDGLVVSYEGRWAGFVAGASYEHLDPRNATDGSANNGKLLPRRARDALRAQGDWMFGQASVGGTLSAFSERFEDAANRLRMAGFTTLDLRADWALNREWTIGARLNNLAGKLYETAYGFNQPGREGMAEAHSRRLHGGCGCGLRPSICSRTAGPWRLRCRSWRWCSSPALHSRDAWLRFRLLFRLLVRFRRVWRFAAHCRSGRTPPAGFPVRQGRR